MAVCLARALIAAHSRAGRLQTQVVVRRATVRWWSASSDFMHAASKLSRPGCMLVDASGQMAGQDEGYATALRGQKDVMPARSRL